MAQISGTNAVICSSLEEAVYKLALANYPMRVSLFTMQNH